MAAIADPPLDTLVPASPGDRVRRAPRRPAAREEGAALPGPRPGRPEGRRDPGRHRQVPGRPARVPTEGTLLTEQGHEVDAAEILEWLQRHPLLGNHDEGFFEVPQAAPPVSEEETERIGEFSLLHDTDSLRAMLESEQRGWNRQGLSAR
jgi:hypothetical protein